MKSNIFAFLLLFTSNILIIAQNNPVAVNDTSIAKLVEYVTVNVTDNDYHPTGLEFIIDDADGYFSKTESTLTFYFDYEKYYSLYYDTLEFSYRLVDESGNSGPESEASVIFIFQPSNFSDTIDIGNISAAVSSYGPLFWPGLTNNYPEEEIYNHFEFPKGSGKQLNYVTNLWVGGIDKPETLRLAAERYRQDGIDYWSGPLNSNNGILTIDTTTPIIWHRVWKVSSAEIRHHLLNLDEEGYQPIESIATWPAHGDTEKYQSHNLAPYVDVDGNDFYEPLKGDYPLIKGDQCIFFIFNDWRQHTSSLGEPIGIEVHAMVYGFDEPENEALFNTLFINYKLINRSLHTLENAYVGFFSDFDLGYYADDYVGCDVVRSTIFGYNGTEVDGENKPDFPGSYGNNPPALGLVMLGGPYLEPNDEDDPSGGCDESINGIGFADGIVDNERFGMTNSTMIYFHEYIFEPNFYYDRMKSILQDNVPQKYRLDVNTPSKFCLPWNTDPCWWGTNEIIPSGNPDWREETANPGGVPSVPGDRNMISSMGPFTFEAFSTEYIDIAFVAARGDDGPFSSVELMKIYIDTIRGRFILDPDNFGNQWLGTEEKVQVSKNTLKISPNPVKSEFWIDYTSDGREVTLSLHDIYGREISRKQVQPDGSFSMSVDHLKKGIYIVSIVDGTNIFTAKVIKE